MLDIKCVCIFHFLTYSHSAAAKNVPGYWGWGVGGGGVLMNHCNYLVINSKNLILSVQLQRWSSV